MCTWAFIIGRLSPDTNGDRRQCRCLRQNQNLSSFFFLHKMHFYFCIQYHIKLFYIKEARHGRMRQRAYQKIFGSTKTWFKKSTKKFGQNRVSNSQDMDDIDKCYQDICCLGKCHLLQMVQKTYL